MERYRPTQRPSANGLHLLLRLPGQRGYLVSVDKDEEWKRSTGLLGPAKRFVPLILYEGDSIPFELDIGSSVTPEKMAAPACAAPTIKM